MFFIALYSFFAACAPFITKAEEKSFLGWMRANQIYYTGAEYNFRLGLFLSKVRFISEFNRNSQKSFKLGLSHLSALTPSEYTSLLGLRNVNPQQRLSSQYYTSPTSSYSAPDSVDWREKNVVVGIKDQGQCGSCWAFSVVQASESLYAIKTGQLISFSDKNILDCTPFCLGCNGGNPVFAYEYVIQSQNGQFNKEEDYPYLPEFGKCLFDSAKTVGKITKILMNPLTKEDQLQKNVAEHGPATVCIDASKQTFHDYASGIYSDSSCSSIFLDHAVGCVGYGTENGEDFWIIRNSWGTTWGENGYIRIARNKGNMCGVASNAIIPLSD